MKQFIYKYSTLPIYIQLIPFLCLYICICLFFSKIYLIGDEGHYLKLSENITKGFFSPPYPNIDLLKGPGYPLFLAPFKMFNFSTTFLKLINALLIYISLIINYKSFRIYAGNKISLVFTYSLALYLPILESLTYMLTECITWLVISAISNLLIRAIRSTHISLKTIFAASILISYLSMIKPIFGYVIIIILFASIILYLFNKNKESLKRVLLIFFSSFILCLPYLLYTHSLTNKIFFWSTSGNWNFYTMTTPYPDEFGDWKNLNTLYHNPNHRKFVVSLKSKNQIEKNEIFKEKAIENIKNHPTKYIYNWLCNISRMLFSFPYSHSTQTITSLWTIIPNMFALVLLFFSIISLMWFKIRIDFEIKLIILFLLLYLFGSSLVSAYSRMFYITMPILAIIIIYCFSKLKIEKRDLNI